MESVRMNLFQNWPDYSLVHCISQDAEMGAGIALQFKRNFPTMQSAVKAVSPNVGTTYAYPVDTRVGTRYVFNMITKARYFHKPTYSDFTDSLYDLARKCQQLNINKLAMPLIGCGLDKLEWRVVSRMIEDTFKDTGIEVRVCFL